MANNKYNVDSLKNLKIKVNDLGKDILDFYKKDKFSPNESFNLITENSLIEIDETIVDEMIKELEKNPTEFEAGKLLYESLKDLTPQQASDIGFWTYLNHTNFYRYISKRWSDVWNEDKNIVNPENYILNHWIQTNSSQSELIDYPISGLWWSFHLSIDDEREDDRYKLTKILFKNNSLRTKYLGAAKFARHKPATHAVLEFLEEQGFEDNSIEQAARGIVPFINLLGGIRPLAYFEKDWFKQKLLDRFGEDIESGNKLFERPVKEPQTLFSNVVETSDEISLNADCYFCLDKKNGNYKLLSKPTNEWDICIGINFSDKNQFLIHTYKEGKIKKTLIDEKLSNKTIDRDKPFKNGKCANLNLHSVSLINEPVLFGIAYPVGNTMFFKAMDEQNSENFRIDNNGLRQQGKKVIYADTKSKAEFKILPYSIKENITRLIQGSQSKGADINHSYYSKEWSVIKQHWPELFNVLAL